MNRLSKFLICFVSLLIGYDSFCQVPLNNLFTEITQISPYYFGPYAFPVPDNNMGVIDNRFVVELAFDYVDGDMGDKTYAPTFSVNIPLWSDRASLRCWGELYEWYYETPESFEFRRIDDEYSMNGDDSGNMYLSLDLQLLKEREILPSLSLSAILLTSVGDDYCRARHYDAPGYAFEASIGKDIPLSKYYQHTIRPAIAVGFVCWQIDLGRQNDAFLFESGIDYRNRDFSWNINYGQYRGRMGKHNSPVGDEGDNPRTITSRVEYSFGKVSPFVYFQKGLKHWPFTQYRVGISYEF